jgi:AMIN domain
MLGPILLGTIMLGTIIIMFRVAKPYLLSTGALVALAALASVPLSAQTPARVSASQAETTPHGSVSPPARVQRVLVRGTSGAIEVEIQTSGGAVAPDTQAITGPDRIIVDFPGALPAAELRALQVNRGPLKAIRAGLFFSNPPITRIVLDLAAPQDYRISTLRNAIVVKLGAAEVESAEVGEIHAAKTQPRPAAKATVGGSGLPVVRIQDASLASNAPATNFARAPHVAAANMTARRLSAADADAMVPGPPSASDQAGRPSLVVVYENGLLQIHADKATMAEVLFEVQRQTQAEIAIPSGAEQEKVVADIGPASSRDVLAALLNGSPYNFIFVGSEEKLERVVLTRRDSSAF